MIATGKSRRPGLGLASGAGLEVVGVEFVKARVGQSQFMSGFKGREFLLPIASQEVADQRGGEAMEQL